MALFQFRNDASQDIAEQLLLQVNALIGLLYGSKGRKPFFAGRISGEVFPAPSTPASFTIELIGIGRVNRKEPDPFQQEYPGIARFL